MFSNNYLIKICFKWKWHLLIVIAVTIALSVFISSPLVITPQYRSTALLYPSNINLLSEESETEQMLEILQSTDIKLMVIEKDSLYLENRYNIDKDYPEYLSTILYEFNKNVSISKTPNDAVRIVVYDKDPELACEIVKSIISCYNIFRHNTFLTKVYNDLKTYNDFSAIIQSDLQKMSKELTTMREEYGLLDRHSQLQNNSIDATTIKNWGKYGAEYEKLDSLYLATLRINNKNQKTIYELTRDLNATKEYCYVVENPFPADAKSKPIRWLIVLLSTLATLFTGIIVAVVYDKYQSTKNNAI